jgi:hypothetical protein
MKEFNRRKFLSALCCLTVTSISCKASLLTPNKRKQTYLNDFEQIRLYWQKNEVINAPEYLLNQGVNNLTSQRSIKSLVVNDFAQDNIITVNGLVLSKTEAAIITATHEAHLHRFNS